MHMDPIMPPLVGAVLAILLIGLLFQRLGQPHVVGYLLGGVLLGPHGLALITDEAMLTHLGSLGVIFLLFFVGMEVSPARLVRGWKISVIGTLFQIVVSVGCVWLLGQWLGWSLHRIILIGFVISLSSTAVVLKVLQDWKELDTEVGEEVLGILLMQDLAVIPMLIIVSTLGGETISASAIGLQITGGALILGLLIWLLSRDQISIPILQVVRKDHEMQVFAALAICFGLSLLTALFGLSSALGAFVAGIVIAAAKETQWVHNALEPFRVVFIALFFVSIGMLVDLNFLYTHWMQAGLLVLAVLLTNMFINAVILRILGEDWRDSLYAGALLSQIGEFSFVLAAVGIQAAIITKYSYQMTLAIISLSLLLSPVWIRMVKWSLSRP